ncbi:Trans-aconitate 2-methyltransferase [Streptomyces alboniger]
MKNNTMIGTDRQSRPARQAAARPGATIWNYLYREPQLYEAVFHGPDRSYLDCCRQMLGLRRAPARILDIGCGTGRDLAMLAADGHECTGIDFQPAMIDYASTRYPGPTFVAADMRTFDLGTTFDLITSFGFPLSNLHSNGDVAAALRRLAAHCAPGARLLLETVNGYAWDTLRRHFTIDTAGVQATGHADYDLDRSRQLLTRRRHWTFADGSEEEDYVQLRQFFPAELTALLTDAGFTVTDVYDNVTLRPSDLTGPELIAVATFAR